MPLVLKSPPVPLSMRVAVLVTALVLAANTAYAAEATPVWNVTGLDNPESVAVDLKTGTLYVSNVAGDLTAKDGNGYIAKLSLDGRVIEQKWVIGLNAPKGLALVQDKLYVADIDQLVEIDVPGRKITKTYPAAGAKFLNDVTASTDDTIFVSDTGTDTIWTLKDGKLTNWLQSADLVGPNGLCVIGDELIVASWGRDGKSGAPAAKGHLLRVALLSKKISPWSQGGPEGNLDGVTADGRGRLLVTSAMEGALYRVPANGPATKLLSLPQSAADLTCSVEKDLVIIPFLMKGNVAAYKLPD